MSGVRVLLRQHQQDYLGRRDGFLHHESECFASGMGDSVDELLEKSSKLLTLTHLNNLVGRLNVVVKTACRDCRDASHPDSSPCFGRRRTSIDSPGAPELKSASFRKGSPHLSQRQQQSRPLPRHPLETSWKAPSISWTFPWLARRGALVRSQAVPKEGYRSRRRKSHLP